MRTIAKTTKGPEAGLDELPEKIEDLRTCALLGQPLPRRDQRQGGRARAADQGGAGRAGAVHPRLRPARVEDRYTLYTTSQNPHLTRLLLGAFSLKVPEHRLCVVAPDVGGGFGSKIFHYAEELLVLWASKRVGRPVKWTSERTEAFLHLRVRNALRSGALERVSRHRARHAFCYTFT